MKNFLGHGISITMASILLVSAPTKAYAYAFVVDDTQATLSGRWKESTFHPNFYGSGYLAAEIDDDLRKVTWVPDLPAPGEYEIYYYLPEGKYNRSSAAKYTIKSNEGTKDVYVDQRDKISKWRSLGRYNCEKGNSCPVVLTNESNDGKFINADAVKYVARFNYKPLENVAYKKSATASSSFSHYQPEKSVDGEISDDSRWISNGGSSWLEIDFGKQRTVQCAHVYNGWQAFEVGIENFELQSWNGSNWSKIPGGSISGNTNNSVKVVFDYPVDAQKIRLTSTDSDKIKIKELKVFNINGYESCPDIPVDPASIFTDILINQSGYNLDEIKRFTAPTLPNGSEFKITKSRSEDVLYKGVINNHIGDFTDFNPIDIGEYQISAGGMISDSFGIGPFWYQRVSYDPMLQFIADARCYVGTNNSCIRGVALRDSHAFSFEMSSLIAQYFSNPSYHENRSHKVNYELGVGPLSPPDIDAPDVVKLIHFTVDRMMKEHVEQGFMKGQLAQFLYAYPYLSKWISKSDYQLVLDYLVPRWDKDNDLDSSSGEATYNMLGNQNMLAVVTKIGGFKGNLPPGYAIMPNLMMYEVAKREGFKDAEKYFDAAYAQTEWLIDNVEWNGRNTKGQRMNERVTMAGLHFFMKMYSDRAPVGLKGKIQSWADKAIGLSDNMWDFRKYDENQWVIPEDYNEPGNVAGLPVALNSAIEFVEDDDKAHRLRELSLSHLDSVFGRNPTGRHFSYTAVKDFEGVERGYFSEYATGLGHLMGTVGKLDGAIKEGHFPYEPKVGQIGRVEAWVAFNTAWNAGLAYNDYAASKVSAYTNGSFIDLNVIAPINMDYAVVETGFAYVKSSNGDVEKVKITESLPNAMNFKGSIRYSYDSPKKNDGILQVSSGDTVEVSYGYDFLKNKVDLMF
ncbi:discoidin domain-containing protein [Vibrio sp. NTOU-M3]|uniref:golvesin C-terminal-like domain-containing protein n=1 Tax=Vibrio sp. NTOU-M3 TaxID=3234954 RepID=UPI00349F7431